MSLRDIIFGHSNGAAEALKAVEDEAKRVVSLAERMGNAAEGEVVKLTVADLDRVRANAVASAEAARPAPAKATRPGDTPPRPFVGKTLDQLTAVLTSYSAERELLVKDIAKLTDEQTQLTAAIEAVQSAIDKLTPIPTTAPVETAVDTAAADALAQAFPYSPPPVTNVGTN